MKIKKGDNIIVIAGKHKSATGKIVRIMGERVLVEGVNKIKVHIKGKTKGEKGSVLEREASIHGSNVMLVDPKSGGPTRISKKKVGDKMVRVTKKSDVTIK